MRKPHFVSILALAVSLPPCFLLWAVFNGLGPGDHTSNGLKALFSGLSVLLPILGLRSLFPKQTWGLPAAAWGWSFGVLAALPFYLPGERAPALERGLTQLTPLIGPHASAALSRTGGDLIRWMGEDSRPAPSRALLAPALNERLGQIQDDRGDLKGQIEPARDLEAESKPDTIILRYTGDNRRLQIPVDVDGPRISERYAMILDTGATYSTLSARALENIGIEIRPDAPWVQLQTAGGVIEAPLALVDAVWLGDVPVEWVTVAVCEACGIPPLSGLVGLNVLQRFRVSIDHENKNIELYRRQRDIDRRLDISHWLDIEGRLTQSSDGRLSLELRGTNRSRQAIRAAVIDLDCSGTGFAIELDHIPAGSESYTQVELPRGTDCEKQTMTLSRAQWVKDRFNEP
ncbi:MAG: hypothetical protein CL917_15425 [Deltaproteobacteria bacterium]|nr:hypothetical protein [Deltaproteobacteria bacterium]